VKGRFQPDRETQQADGSLRLRPRIAAHEGAESLGPGLERLQKAAGNHALQQALRPPDAQPQTETTSAPASLNAGVDRALGPGLPLDFAAREEMGGQLGADLSEVRLHSDAAAAESAQRLHAAAYTLGPHIVFGADAEGLNTSHGRSLLAHELAHVLQQRRDHRPRIQRQAAPGQDVDVDVVPESQAEADRLKNAGVNLPQVGPGTWQATGGSPYTDILPAYSQQGDSCGAASLVSALLIWDREHWDPAHPNSRAVDACDLIILELERHGSAAVERWANKRPQAQCNGDHACNVALWQSLRDQFVALLVSTRNTARTPGGKVSESDYQQLGLSLYFLWNQGNGAGLGSGEIFNIQSSLGMSTQFSVNITDFDNIFTNAIVASLAPDEIAQVFWFVKPSGQQHAFLVGRLANGKWFLSDQGPSPAVQFQTDTLEQLHTSVRVAASTGGYWLFVGSVQDYMQQAHVLPGYVGVQKLGSPGGTQEKVEATVPPGSELGEVDAGFFTIGDSITSGAFAGRMYALDEAKAALPAGGGGGAIVELPSGVFSVYQTSAVSDANLDQTALDASDSTAMLLGGARRYHHAWLILGNRFGVRRAWFQVY
jgi:Domain of unknown function (DUF4157)